MIDIEKIIKELQDNKLYNGRMISHSKSFYRNVYPYNSVYFNANIFVFNGNEFEKIWYGDIDINKDGYLLKEIAFNNNVILYILSEFDGRFDNTNTQNVMNKYVFNTTMDVAIIDDEYIKNRKEKAIKDLKIRKEIEIKKNKEDIKTNNGFPIITPKKLLNSTIIKKIIVDEKDINKEFNIYKKEILKNINSLKDDDLEEYLYMLNKEIYFSYKYLSKLIIKKMKLKNEQEIKITQYWGNENLDKMLEKYDYKINKSKYKKRKYKKLLFM